MAVTWIEQDEQTNALATVTIAALANRRHQVVCVLGSFNAASPGRLLNLKIGGVSKMKLYIHDSGGVAFQDPIEVPVNTTVSLELAAGGAGVLGSVVLIGNTL